MRLDLAERLRCPQDHVPTPLVVVAREKHGSDLREGFAGCMVCRLEARITAGDLHFGPTMRTGSVAPVIAEAARTRSISPPVADATPPDIERVIALLGLSEPGGAVLLTGRYAMLADALAALVDVAVVVMASATRPRATDQVASVVGLGHRVPFTDGTFRAAAMDTTASPAFAQDVARSVAVGGRVLGGAALPSAPGLKELARDAIEWVAEREADVARVELRRG